MASYRSSNGSPRKSSRSFTFFSPRRPHAHDVSPRKQVYEAEAVSSQCIVSGAGMRVAMARKFSTFEIEARDAAGERIHRGGDPFMVAIRGASTVKARVTDLQNGIYRCDCTPMKLEPTAALLRVIVAAPPGSALRLVLTPRVRSQSWQTALKTPATTRSPSPCTACL